MALERSAGTVALRRTAAAAALTLGAACTAGSPPVSEPGSEPSATSRSTGETPGTAPAATVPTATAASPTARSTATGTPGTTSAPTVTVLLVGDIMLGRAVGALSRAAGDVAAPLRPLQRRLAAADLTVGNLESTLSMAGPPRQGDDSFAADPGVLTGLRDAGFDVLSLANNHTGDFGLPALRQTVRRVHEAGIREVGAGRDLRSAWRPVVLSREGITFGFLAFNAIGETPRATRRTPGAASVRMQPRTGPLSPRDLAATTARVRRLADRVDVVIVLPHWGDQYTHRPVPDQRRVGRALIDAGASVVVGGHPHWVQDVEMHAGRLLVHSLGNFVFDMDFSLETREGAMLALRFRADQVAEARLVPYLIDERFRPRLVRGAAARSVFAGVRGLRHVTLADEAMPR